MRLPAYRNVHGVRDNRRGVGVGEAVDWAAELVKHRNTHVTKLGVHIQYELVTGHRCRFSDKFATILANRKRGPTITAKREEAKAAPRGSHGLTHTGMGRGTSNVGHKHVIPNNERIVARGEHPHIVPGSFGSTIKPWGSFGSEPCVSVTTDDKLGV